MRLFWKTAAGKALIVVVMIAGVAVVFLIAAASRHQVPRVAITPEQATFNATPSTASTGSSTSGRYKDGTFTGATASTRYGNVQVALVISGGKITDVKFLQTPNDRDRSVEINSFAKPALKSEIIKAQSANVDTVSGATTSSEGFMESASSALSQAA